jgi:hypothetical protein
MRRVRRLVGAWLAIATIPAGALLLLKAPSAGAAYDPTTSALLYLQSQQSPADGSVPPLYPGSYRASVLYAIDAAAAGYDPNALRTGNGPSVVDYLRAGASAICQPPTATSTSAANCAQLVQVAVAARRRPAAFGGVDLLARLLSYYDPSTGRFGDGEAFAQTLAVQALAGAHRQVPPAALTFLEGVEDSDGGWDYRDVRDDPHAAKNGDSSDTNSTAMALMALDAAGDHSRDAPALGWLHGVQKCAGGFSYQPPYDCDPDSTALVAQAITAAGQDPSGPVWALGAQTPDGWLRAAQEAGGGFAEPYEAAPTADTTAQAAAGLAGKPFPIRPSYQPGARLPAPGGTPSPMPTPTGSPGPAGVVTPSSHSAPARLTGSRAAASVAAAAASSQQAGATSPPAGGSSTPAPATAAPHTGGRRSIAAAQPAGGAPLVLLYVAIALVAALAASGAWLLWARRRRAPVS